MEEPFVEHIVLYTIQDTALINVMLQYLDVGAPDYNTDCGHVDLELKLCVFAIIALIAVSNENCPLKVSIT